MKPINLHHFAKLVTLRLLRAYKWAVSPLFPPACRYVPTCSEYAMEAVERHGALRGMGMALGRLFRCHPFARGGYDPVAVTLQGARRQPELSRMTNHQGPTRSAGVPPDGSLRKA